MAHQHTRKEAHLLSGPSELQPTEHPETQKLDSAHVQQTRQEYSQLTETEKAKFQNPFIYNDDRNFVRHNSVNKISPNLVFMTTQNTSLSNLYFAERKEENVEDAEQQKLQKDLHLHLQKDLPVPAPAATLEKVHKRPHSKTAKKSTDNFGRPASMNSDFYSDSI